MPIAYFDGHCDTVSRCLRTGEGLDRAGGHIDLRRGGAFSAYAQFFALFYDSAGTAEAGLAIAARQREFLMRELAANGERVIFCRTAEDVRRAVRRGRIAALLGIEGAELLDCDPARIDVAADWGARYVTLTWNHANALSGSNCDGADRGLTDRGRAFVRELYGRGILPDVSHLSDAGFWDVIGLGLGPVAATHSDSRALCGHPRNLTDAMFRAIGETGGVVGLNFYRAFVGPDGGDFSQLLRHIDHFLELGGEDVLCFGGDLDGCDALCGGMRGLESVPRLYDACARHGYDRALLEKLFFQNWLRLLARIDAAGAAKKTPPHEGRQRGQ